MDDAICCGNHARGLQLFTGVDLNTSKIQQYIEDSNVVQITKINHNDALSLLILTLCLIETSQNVKLIPKSIPIQCDAWALSIPSGLYN